MAKQHNTADTKQGHCTECGDALALHIGHKACVSGEQHNYTSIYDLPIARRIWTGQAH